MRPTGRKSRPNRPGAPPLLARGGRFALVMAAVIAGFIGVAGRLCWLQWYNAEYYRADAEGARRYRRITHANRGRIFDTSGAVVFATADEVWDIGVDPNGFSERNKKQFPQIVDALAPLVGKTPAELSAVFSRKIRILSESGKGDDGEEVEAGAAGAKSPADIVRIRWVKLADGVSAEKKEKISAAMAGLGVKAVYPVRRFIRKYPKGELASQLLGYVNKGGVPAMGVEKALDYMLKGEDGWIDSQKDNGGRELGDRRIREFQSRDGADIVLTIDAFIQQTVENELKKVGEAYHPKSATAVVSDAKTGRILAMSSWPSFDLNEYGDLGKSPLENQKNRAVTDVYEPGSVFKIVSYAAAIQEGLITPQTMFDCGEASSSFSALYKGKLLPLMKDDHTLGRADVTHGVWKSSNRMAAQIGMRVAEVRGEETLWRYMADFGFGSESGLIPGSEVKGVLTKPKNWDGLTITRLPAGHSVNVTVLQMHYGMGVIASGGDLLAPALVREIRPSPASGNTAIEFPVRVRKRGVISKAVAATVTEMLRGVPTPNGTAKDAAIPDYDVAGKTGTTTKLTRDPTTGKVAYDSRRHVASFSGFFPASDPRVVITVVLDEPGGKGIAYGGVYAAPVFKEIGLAVIKYLEIPKPAPLIPPGASLLVTHP